MWLEMKDCLPLLKNGLKLVNCDIINPEGLPVRKLDLSNISFNKLQIFVAAAESKSFSLAGEKLNITHSAVSKNISALENYLNLILFIKDRNGASLTPAGKFLYEKTRDMFSLFNTNIEKST